ncbi:MFS transporter [Ammoniphilus sp. 3BR4]|uniref:MFS transporter n=1 Tax=Ammoniphilus sp. 3BR4 TaxID=3158265 RepID=UPI0034659FB2
MFRNNYRWFIMSFISILMVINFMDRVVVSIATGPIMKEFGFTNTQWGIILSAFFWGLVPFSLIAGVGADKFGPKKIWVWGVTLWSVCTMGTAWAWNFISLVVARVLFGVGEGPTLSNGIRIMTNWMSPKEYGSATGVAFGGIYLGPAFGAPIIVWMISEYGWRMPFYVMGLLGLIWVLGWYKWFTDRPENNKYVSKEEKEWILKEQEGIASSSTGEQQSIKQLLMIPKGVRGTIIANWWSAFCFGYALYFLMTWLPGYLNMQRGFDMKSMGFALMFPWIGAALGLVFGGRFSDFLLKRTGSKRIARAYLTAGSFLVVAVTLFYAVKVDSALYAIILLTAAAMVNAVTGALVAPVVVDTMPEQAGSQGGLLQLFQTFPGIFAPILTGYIVDSTQSFNYAFYFAAFLVLTATITSFVFIRPPQQQHAAEKEKALIMTH